MPTEATERVEWSAPSPRPSVPGSLGPGPWNLTLTVIPGDAHSSQVGLGPAGLWYHTDPTGIILQTQQTCVSATHQCDVGGPTGLPTLLPPADEKIWSTPPRPSLSFLSLCRGGFGMEGAPTTLLQLPQAGPGHPSLQGLGLEAGAPCAREGETSFGHLTKQLASRSMAQPMGKSSPGQPG